MPTAPGELSGPEGVQHGMRHTAHAPASPSASISRRMSLGRLLCSSPRVKGTTQYVQFSLQP